LGGGGGEQKKKTETTITLGGDLMPGSGLVNTKLLNPLSSKKARGEMLRLENGPFFSSALPTPEEKRLCRNVGWEKRERKAAKEHKEAI